MKIFITGVSAGIGESLAKQLLQAGHEVWGVARREELMNQIKIDFTDKKFFYSICDVSEEAQIKNIFCQTQEANFIPDVVVLNAGLYEPDLDGQYDHAKASALISTNFLGALSWVEKFLPLFEVKNSGQFIAISSLIVFRPDISSASYPASKAALSMAFRSFRLRYADTKIKFKTIHFGPIATLVLARYGSIKQSHLIPSPKSAARFIIKAIRSSRQVFYYPFFISLFLYITRWIPDKIFYVLTRHLRR